MFQIRSEQVRVFEIKQQESFIQRMIIHLQTNFPEQTQQITPKDLRRFVEDETETAQRFEIYNEVDVALCITAIFSIRPNLNSDPEPTWVKEVQSDPDLTSEQKAERLCQWAEQEIEEQTKNE